MLTLTLADPQIPDDVIVPRREDIDRAKKVIEQEDNLVAGYLVCARAGHCALGALLFAAGYTNKQLVMLSSSYEDFPYEARLLLWRFYRIGDQAAGSVMRANDDAEKEGAEFDYDGTLLGLPTGGEIAEDFRAGEARCHVNFLVKPSAEEVEQRKADVLAAIEHSMTKVTEHRWYPVDAGDNVYDIADTWAKSLGWRFHDDGSAY